MRPVGIDLFAGAGGLSLGFEQAGFDVAAAVEIDPVHCAVHKFNFPKTAIIPRTVEGLSAASIRMAAGIGDRQVDCVFGGAPCQGFSLIGHRALDDSRNRLVLDFVRIVAELKARTFVFENVKGLTLGKHKTFLNELFKAFDDAGYEVRTPWKVLNAGHYGAPQFRERLILFGCRKGETLPDYPAPSTNLSGRKAEFEGLPDGPNCIDALGDLPDADRFQTLLNSDAVKTTGFGEPSRYAAELRCMNNEAWHYGYVRDWNPAILTSSARTDHTEISRRRFCETEPGSVEPISRFFKLADDGVSNTLRAGTDGARGAFTSPRPIHYRYDRCVTVREMARLHGFPDWFRFQVTKWHGARQIGNAVPPPLARAIATGVMKSLAIEPSRPESTLALGGESLLSLDLSGAADHFGVEAPSSRRNQKSGAKKRKQIDIERERLAEQVAHG
ncbi:cytosine-specific methyltransferase [Iodidimonas nitroreducens]|uniref:Cytosine-specific methyltransferase n=1 Tax=Iodidimonas nitroreducens TaxID=1236968 RepID=A0A5A7NAN4_9PROT|nr:DNA cytosine methyltransferase [Iodidimonas nitroreducens]GAK34519.1 modification methylase XorII [alpha proteobacterium Q-1]GER05441.1 cytosine-specific methyltransferase [Iodidimonas nitroreducens]